MQPYQIGKSPLAELLGRDDNKKPNVTLQICTDLIQQLSGKTISSRLRQNETLANAEGGKVQPSSP